MGDVPMTVFHSLADAIRAGFMIYDKTATGYLVRQRVAAGWQLAIVECSP